MTATLIRPSEAAQELLKRRRARNHLFDYMKYVVPNYIEAEHNRVLCEKLEAVERGEIKRLMVFEPPRHSKSIHVSQGFPNWVLGRNPQKQIVQSGYAAPIALEHSRKARDLFVTPENQRIFPNVHHKPGTAGQDNILVQRQAAHEWGTVQGGRYYAVGVGGGLTGRGADIAIIDDPVKDRSEAESETITKATIDWYKSVLYTRLSPDGAIILVMTRWSPNDLAGHLLEQESKGEGDKWEKVIFPAINKDGEALWPERFNVEALTQIKKTIGQHEWSALYQQEPVVRGGNMFKVDNFVWHNDASDFPATTYVRFWDLASTKKERAKDDPDYTVGALVGITRKYGLDIIWVKDVVCGQWEAPERNNRIIATAKKDGPAVRQLVESVAGYKDAYTTLKDLLRGVASVVKVDVSTDKVVRCSVMEPVIEESNFHIVRGQHADLIDSCFRQFPNGSHDDPPDAIAGAYNYLRNGLPQAFDRAAMGI